MRRTFVVYRTQPPQGHVDAELTNRGAQPDLEGVIFSDGTVAIRWLTTYRSHATWRDYECFYRVHGHPEYGTKIVFDDGYPPPGYPLPHEETPRDVEGD